MTTGGRGDSGPVRLRARVIALCVVLLAVLVVFDAQAERFTSGLTPLQFRAQLDGELRAEYAELVGVAHNAGDDIGAANEAAAHGVDAVEIDVTSIGGELHASHDAPVPYFETLLFRGPDLEDAWDAARLPDTVLLDLKESDPAYLEDVAGSSRRGGTESSSSKPQTGGRQRPTQSPRHQTALGCPPRRLACG